jgi:hypothetical protein
VLQGTDIKQEGGILSSEEAYVLVHDPAVGTHKFVLGSLAEGDKVKVP